MKPNELQKWMDENGKTATQVAGEMHVNVRTVERFLAGETDPSPLVVEALKKLVDKK